MNNESGLGVPCVRKPNTAENEVEQSWVLEQQVYRPVNGSTSMATIGVPCLAESRSFLEEADPSPAAAVQAG
jgi:hypothetical protein